MGFIGPIYSRVDVALIRRIETILQMKLRCSGILLAGLIFSSSSITAQDRGEDLFNQTCVACHTIGGGRIVGPDLANVHTRRDESWILTFVKSPQSFANSGNAAAAALLAEFNGLVMPDQTLSDDDIRAVIGFIARTSPADGSIVAEMVEEVNPEDLAAEQIQLGQDLFVGRIRFENGASACSSCHSVDTGMVMTGGSLAKNLTDAVPRLTRNGVDAMMANPPFPAMRSAFIGKALTDTERAAVVDFLQASAQSVGESVPMNYANQLIMYGLMGLAVLLGLFFLIGLRGSKESVNQAIYDRQISST